MKGAKPPNPLEEELGVSILDNVTGRFNTVLRVALQRTCPRSHVCALFEVFGKENFLKFLDLFAGTEVKVPTKNKLEDAVRQVGIYMELKKASPRKRPPIVRDLAKKFGLTAGEVRKVFVELDKLFEEEGYLLPDE